MILTRVIPCLLLQGSSLVKTTKFKKRNYIGDPVNAVKLFNEKQANELLIIDIDATTKNKEPNYKLIEEIASEAFMPVCYGGGIKTVEQMQRIFNSGIEKISVSSLLFDAPEIVKQGVERFGSSSIAATLDVKTGLFGRRKVYTHNGARKIAHTLEFAVDLAVGLGVGELVINSIDRDGTMGGYDMDLIESVTSRVGVPVIAVGGAGKLEDIQNVVKGASASAASAGSLFVYHGPRRAVLINYPNEATIDELLG